MIQNFRTHQLATDFYRNCRDLKVPAHLRDQLLRAASSVVLNLGEGSEKPTRADKLRFYFIAFCSHREVQSILQLVDPPSTVFSQADHLGACLYKLTHPKP